MNSLLVYIAAVASALFGLSMAILPTKNAHGTITLDAKLMFAGIALCAILSVVATKISERNTEIESSERHKALLSTVAREARRIDSAQIRVVVSYDVNFPGVTISGPNFLNGKWTADMYVQHTRPDFPLNTWASGSMLVTTGKRLQPAVNQTYPRIQHQNGGGFLDTAVEVFTDFVGDLDEYAEPSAWNGAYVEFDLVSKKQLEQLGPFIENWPYFHERQADPDPSKNPSPPTTQIYDAASCKELEFSRYYEIRHFQAFAHIYVGGRQVASTEGRIVLVDNSFNDREDAVLKFPIVQVASNLFADTTHMAVVIPPKPTILSIIGWCIVTLIVCTGITLILRTS